MKEENRFYVYTFLDQRKPGTWIYEGYVFDFKPFYVGKGCDYRMTDHFLPSSLKYKCLKNNIIKKIKNTVNEWPVHFSLYTNLNQINAFLIEKNIIKHFGRIDLKTGILSNHTDGGENGNLDRFKKPVWQYCAETGLFKRSYESVKNAENLTNISGGHIAYAIKNNGTAHNYIWSYQNLGPKIEPRKRYPQRDSFRLYQYHKNGTFIQDFKNAKEAASKLNLPLCRSTFSIIRECSLGRCKTAFEYMWKREYLGVKINSLVEHNNCKYNYIQKDINDNIIEIFKTEKEALIKIGKEKSLGKINWCATGHSETYCGFKWSRTPKS